MEDNRIPVGKYFESQETGSWRALKPVVISTKCNKCGLCVIYCPEGVMFKVADGVEVDYQFCKGCGICAIECNQRAIEMQLENET